MYKFTILVFFFTCTISAQINSGEILYGQDFFAPQSSQSVTVQPLGSIYKDELKRISIASKQVEYKLSFNKERAMFKALKSLSVDNNNDVELAIFQVDGDGVRYYSNSTKVRMWDHYAFDKKVILVDSILPEDWLITNESKMVNGEKVYKAVLQRKSYSNNQKIIAWFNPNIPFSYGPLGYNGLPGMIIEISTKDFRIFAKAIKFSKKDIVIKFPTKGEFLTQEKYQKLAAESVQIFSSNKM